MKTPHKHGYIPLTLIMMLACNTLMAAHDINEWRTRTTRIADDPQLTDSMKVVRLSDLTYNYFYYYRTFFHHYLDEYLQLAERFVDNENRYDLLSYIYGTAVIVARGKQAIPMIEKCEYYTDKSANPLIRAKGWERLGRKYLTEATGLDYLSRSLDALEGTTHFAEQSSANRYIGFYYSLQGDTANEMKYALRTLELARLSGDLHAQIDGWESVAQAHHFQNNYPAAIEAYNKERELYIEKLKKNDPDPDLQYRDEMYNMVNLVNLGSIYYNTGDFTTAIEIITEALETANCHSFVETQAYCHKELGRIHTDLKQYPTAEIHLLRAAALLATDYVGTSESSYIDYEVNLALGQLYGLTGEYRRSVGYYHEGIRKYRDLHDEEQMSVNQQYAANYETRMQEEAITRMETVMSYQEHRRLIYAAILIVALIALYMVARLYRTRINLARQIEETLCAQARLLTISNRKAELDNQLKQQEADALLRKLALGNQLREDCNRSFDDVNTFFTCHPELGQYQNQVKNIIHQQSRLDNNVEDYIQGITDVPLEFYTQLQKIAENKLTPHDLKYCRLIYLETSTKDIVALLSVEPKTVRMAKYRLKQKLKLDKEEDLNEFIRNIATS